MRRLLLFCACMFALSLSACTPKTTPTQNAAPVAPIPVPVTQTPLSSPTTAPPTATPTPQPATPITYYYFVQLGDETPPAGSLQILPDELVLAPTLAPVEGNPDPASNIESALQKMLLDSRNLWESTGVDVTSVTFDNGAVEVILDGEYFAVGGIVQMAARDQIVMTIFSQSPVQSARVMLNGKNIVNLGNSSPVNVAPEDYRFTRDEVESYMASIAYQAP